MVYLKRFVFHEMTSIKVDDPVHFSTDSLDMSPYIQGPEGGSSQDNIYTLQAYVCHTGSVTSGHYTSFARQCVSGEWLYFNDETVSCQEPSKNDERAYVLFYQRPAGCRYTPKHLLEPSEGAEESTPNLGSAPQPPLGSVTDSAEASTSGAGTSTLATTSDTTVVTSVPNASSSSASMKPSSESSAGRVAAVEVSEEKMVESGDAPDKGPEEGKGPLVSMR
jgi:hypothetical protein